jgi:Helix-turn-helix domain
MLTVPQIAAMTGRSRRTIIRWFENEPDIFVMDNPETMHKRRYRSLRIPRAALERVMRRKKILA